MRLREFRRIVLSGDPTQLFRRYFVNTLFDSTFVVLGVLAASAFTPDANVSLTLGTVFAACLAIGISTGVSVYEAEHAEEEIRLLRIERAMLSPMRDTDVGRRMRAMRYAIVIVNFLAPLLVASLTGIPIVLFHTGVVPTFPIAAGISVAIGVGIIFSTGYYLGSLSGRRPWVKAARMGAVALLTFLVLVALERAL